jgi:hypothetical protein
MAIKTASPLAAVLQRWRELRAEGSWLVALLLVFVGAGCGSGSSGGAEATVDDLNRAYKAWGMMRGSYPTNIYELTNHPALQGKRLPALPPGKRLILDGNARQIVVGDE